MKSKDTNISPTHYKLGGIETIDYIKAKLTKEQYEGYLSGNVLKYMSRYRTKNGEEDLKKAQQYLTWLIESQRIEPEITTEPMCPKTDCQGECIGMSEPSNITYRGYGRYFNNAGC